jgi:hypothetical protein
MYAPWIGTTEWLQHCIPWRHGLSQEYTYKYPAWRQW